MKRANRAYEVLGNGERRRKYHEEWLRSNSAPKPVVVPSSIVFRDAVPGEAYTGSFVIRNDGGVYESIWIGDPGSWVQVTGYASLESDDELPLQVEVTASGYGFGRTYAESIAVRLDEVEAAVNVQIRTKPAPAPGYAEPAAATVQPAGIPGWAKALGIAAAVAAGVMVIVSSIPDQTGSANNGSPGVNQTWSNGSNYLGSPQRSRGSQPWTQGSQFGNPGSLPGVGCLGFGPSSHKAFATLSKPVSEDRTKNNHDLFDRPQIVEVCQKCQKAVVPRQEIVPLRKQSEAQPRDAG